MEIYEPREDSFFLANFLKNYLKKNKVKNYLDMGTGSGILSGVASEFIDKDKILAVDINLASVKILKKKNFSSLKSNLFSKIPRNKKFDLITFNAPYLPEDENYKEPKESKTITTGGKRGDEISIKFLKQAEKFLKNNGRIFLLISSLTPLERIKKFNPKKVSEKKLFLEKLFILEFNKGFK